MTKVVIKGFLITFIIIGVIFYALKLYNDVISDFNSQINGLKEDNQKLKNEFDSVNNINNNIVETLYQYQNKIDSLELEDDNLKKLYDENKRKSKKLQDSKKDISPRIDTMGSHDIKKYFSKFE